MSRRSPDDFASTLQATLVRALQSEGGAAEAQAREVAREVVMHVTHQFQGERVYIRGPRYDAAAVARDFTGANHEEVARKHGVSVSTVYRVLRERKGPKAGAAIRIGRPAPR